MIFRANSSGVALRSRHVVSRPSTFLARGVAALLCLIALLLIPSTAAAQTPDTEVDGVVTAPVEIDGRVLFRVRGVSSLPAEQRAERIRQQMLDVAADRSV